MKLFAQLRKVDEEKRLVFGRIAQEVVDKADEVMDYESSKPHFVKWSQDIAADTDGKSLGNVRAMHGKVAAGKLVGIDFQDAEKAIDVCAKVVDDNEWNKVLEGIYTGFSVGGSYGPKTVEKVDDRDVTRYTAIPSEVSLVDRPCIPTARFFEVQKADGTLAKVDFKAPVDEPAAAAPSEEDLTVNGSPEDVAKLAKVMNELGLNVAQVIEKVAERKDVDEADKKRAKEKYGDVEYADEKNKKYPLDTPEHVRAAASYFGKESNRSKYDAEDQKKIDAKIAAAKKKHGIGDESKEDAEKALSPRALRKGLYTCGVLASTLQDIEYICRSVCYEAEAEGDGSDLGRRLMQWLADGGEILQAMVEEEVAEATEGKEEGATAVMAMSERAGALVKLTKGDLAKIGARNSKADAERIQKMHDHTVELGAACGAAKAAGGDLEKLVPGGDLQKFVSDAVTAAVDPLNKALGEAAEKIKKLEAQPAPTRLALRVVSKSDDIGGRQAQPETKPVVDAHGETHGAATLIKSLHQSGGAPLVAPLRK